MDYFQTCQALCGGGATASASADSRKRICDDRWDITSSDWRHLTRAAVLNGALCTVSCRAGRVCNTLDSYVL